MTNSASRPRAKLRPGCDGDGLVDALRFGQDEDADEAGSRETEDEPGEGRSEGSVGEQSLVEGGADGGEAQVDDERGGVGVDGVLEDLGHDADAEDLVADAEQAGDEEREVESPGGQRVFDGFEDGLTPGFVLRGPEQDDAGAEEVEGGEGDDGGAVAEGRDDEEGAGEDAGGGAEGVDSVDPADGAPLLRQRRHEAVHRGQGRAHGGGGGEQREEWHEEGNGPVAGRGGIDTDEVVDDGVDPRDEGDGGEGPEADDEFERRVPVAGDGRAADAFVEEECADGEAAEERGDDGEDAGHLVAETDGEHARPDDLVAEPGDAGAEEDGVGEEDEGSAGGHGFGGYAMAGRRRGSSCRADRTMLEQSQSMAPRWSSAVKQGHRVASGAANSRLATLLIDFARKTVDALRAIGTFMSLL